MNINEIIKKKIILRLLFNFVIFTIFKAKITSNNLKQMYKDKLKTKLPILI